MRYRVLLPVVAFAVLLLSCKKDIEKVTVPPPVQTKVLLKDIEYSNLPSPYYHFEYNASGAVTKASLQSGIRMYDVLYNGDAISEMKTTTPVNKDRLQYILDEEGRVDIIKYVNEAGVTYRIVSLTYEGNFLRLIEWETRVAAGFIIDRTVSFVYQPDGNILEMTDHRHDIPGRPEASNTTRFEQYDDKVNTDGFSVFHDSNHDHLFLLPGVQLQKNNARRVIFTGTGNNYTIDYTYTYNAKNAPLTKAGDVLFTSGPNAGQRFQVSALFSYY